MGLFEDTEWKIWGHSTTWEYVHSCQSCKLIREQSENADGLMGYLQLR